MQQLFQRVRLVTSGNICDVGSASLRWDQHTWPNAPVCGIAPVTEWVDAAEIGAWVQGLAPGSAP